MQVVIDWPHKDHFPVSLIERGCQGKVILMLGFGDNVRLLHLIKDSDQLICFTPGDYREAAYDSMRRLMRAFDISPSQVSVLCNYPEQVELARAAELNARLCNTNAFINEQVFRQQPMTKQFDAVSNARLVKLKRVGLARMVKNLAIIRGHQLEDTEYDDPADIPHSYINLYQLSRNQVARVLSASRVGLALSAAEGACASSSEYLLCGLPVVSTPSRGGRDIWYNSDNSIICEPSAESVSEAVDLAIRRLAQGSFDPVSIRHRHIEQSKEHRRMFVEELQNACTAAGVRTDPSQILASRMGSLGIIPPYMPFQVLEQELGT